MDGAELGVGLQLVSSQGVFATTIKISLVWAMEWVYLYYSMNDKLLKITEYMLNQGLHLYMHRTCCG